MEKGKTHTEGGRGKTPGAGFVDPDEKWWELQTGKSEAPDKSKITTK